MSKKLSIIIPFYKTEYNNLNKLFKGVINEAVEFIFVFDSTDEDDLKLATKLKSKNDDQFKLIFNRKKASVLENFLNAIDHASANKIMVLFPSTKTYDDEINALVKQVEKNDVDVLEFQPNFGGKLNWKPKRRIPNDKVYNLENKEDFIAYTFPTIANKVFSKRVFENLNLKNLYLPNTKYSVAILYHLMNNANSYYYLNQAYLEELIYFESNISLNVFLSDWKNIFTLMNDKNKQSLIYAQTYFFSIYLAGSAPFFLKNRRGDQKWKTAVKTQTSKLQKYILELNENQKSLIKENKFLQTNKKENQLMTNPVSDSEWKEIFKEL